MNDKYLINKSLLPSHMFVNQEFKQVRLLLLYQQNNPSEWRTTVSLL